jgi:hypothetical protein
MADRPDILVNDDGRIVGLRETTGRRLFSTDRANNFDIQSWRRRDGEDPDAPAPTLASSGRSADGSIVCIASACTMTRAGVVVAYVRTRAGLQRSCRTAQIVITSLDAGSCGAANVIDRDALIRDGPHAVHIRDARWTVSTVRGESGRRRWTAFNSGG